MLKYQIKTETLNGPHLNAISYIEVHSEYGATAHLYSLATVYENISNEIQVFEEDLKIHAFFPSEMLIITISEIMPEDKP